MLVYCNVISLKCNNTSEVVHTTFIDCIFTNMHLMYESESMLYTTSIYTCGTHLGHGLCLLLISTLFVSLLCRWLIYTACVHNSWWNYYCYIPLLLMKSPPMPFNAFHWWVFKYCTCLNNTSIPSNMLITLTMTLHMGNNHIKYCHTKPTWVVHLVWSYFSHPLWLSNAGSVSHFYFQIL